MLKAIGMVQLCLAPMFVIPALTGQEAISSDLDTQLEATKQSIEYLVGLRPRVQAGDETAIRALKKATESPRDASPQRDSHITALRDDIAKLRFTLDRLLANPSEVTAIMNMPPSVVRVLGLSGAATATQAAPSAGALTQGVSAQNLPGATPGVPTGAVPTGSTQAPIDPNSSRAIEPIPPRLAGTTNTTGLTNGMRRAIAGDVGPLDSVTPSSRRRGDEAIALEGENYVADPMRLGRLLVRAHRPAEAVEILERHPDVVGAQYWLARAYQDLDRSQEALLIYRALIATAESSTDKTTGTYARYAAQDLEFLEFKLNLEARRAKRSSR